MSNIYLKSINDGDGWLVNLDNVKYIRHEKTSGGYNNRNTFQSVKITFFDGTEENMCIPDDTLEYLIQEFTGGRQ